MPELDDKDWCWYLKTKVNSYLFPKTKLITTKKQINTKILTLLNEKAEIVSQLSTSGLIVLDKTVLNSCDKKSISEQGIISSDFFKARIINVNNQIIKGVYFHFVKVISGIIAINQEHEVILESDQEFNKKLFDNKLVAKLFMLFLNQYNQTKTNLIIKNKIKIDNQRLQLWFNKKSNLTKDLIFEVRDLVNKFLTEKKINNEQYHFLENNLTKIEIKNLFRLEKIEIEKFFVSGTNFVVNFLVGTKNIELFFANAKKELLAEINVINKKIKLINNDNLVCQFYSTDEIKTYQDLEKLKQDYFDLKMSFIKFQNQNPILMKKFVDQSVAAHYSEKIADYEIIHISFDDFLIDKKLLELKAKERLTETDNKILFLSNNNIDNCLLVWKISSDLHDKIDLKALVKKYSSSSFIKIYYKKYDTVFIEANNYQDINDFIRNIINFFKNSDN